MKQIASNLLLIFLVISPLILNAQRQCGSYHYHELQMQKEGYQQNRQQFEADYQKHKQQKAALKTTSVTTYVIPVVVHVVYNTTAQNISDEQIQSQIDILNADFSATNADYSNIPALFQSVKGNPDIQFCLATVDPNGQETNGITRTLTSITSFSYSDPNEPMKYTSLGGHDAWDSESYLNLWVCNLGGGILGYATFPGTSSVDKDGVVIGYKYFGKNGVTVAPYNKGRTATHEVGHWLGLYHIWGDDAGDPDECAGSDLISDTPNQREDNAGCPTFPRSTCGNTSDMFMNYMDYTDDACMYMFTAEQSDRMRFSVANSRPKTQTWPGCVTFSNFCTGLNTITTSSGTIGDGSGSTRNYLHNTNCSYLIQPPGANTVTIEFFTLDTENTYDVVSVYDGIDATATLIGSYSGNSVPSTITSSGGSIFITFTSDGSVNATGWTILYTANYNGCSGTQTYQLTSGTISDGSGAGNYADNADCYYLIQPYFASYVQLTFTALDLESGVDSVTIYNGATTAAPIMGVFTGNSVPGSPITSSDGAMLVWFNSNGSGNAAGFSANYTSDGDITVIKNSNMLSNLELYPVPASEELIFKGINRSEGNVTLEVLDVLGNGIMSTEITGTDLYQNINISQLTPGVYILAVKGDGFAEYLKFIKQ